MNLEELSLPLVHQVNHSAAAYTSTNKLHLKVWEHKDDNLASLLQVSATRRLQRVLVTDLGQGHSDLGRNRV